MLTCRSERFPRLGKMNRPNRFGAVAVLQVLRQQRFNRCRVEVLEKPINDAAQHPLRKTFGAGIDRRDPAKMDRLLLVVLNHLKFRMIHANSASPEPRLAEDDELLSSGDHFLDVVQIKPPADERLTVRVRIRFLQCRLKNLFPAAETPERRFDHLSRQTDRHVALIARGFPKLMSIFVSSREMIYQIFRGLSPKSLDRP